MERITEKTRLGPKLATLVCPKCHHDGQTLYSLRNVKGRKVDCSHCDEKTPLLTWLIRRG